MKDQLHNLITQLSTSRNLAEAIASTMTVGEECNIDFSEFKDDGWSVEFSEFEVWKYLCELPLNKAAGVDGIPNKVYSVLADYIASPLTTLFERSISQRRFPAAWKGGIVVPIPKTSPPQLEKMRTITLLPAPSKILEKIVLRSIRMKVEPLLGKNQQAYRKGLSTTTALLQINDAATRIHDNVQNKGCAILSLDFTKAFDKVDHRVLLQKVFALSHTGFGLWLADYLTRRSFRVRIQGEFSDERQLFAGLPQGSVSRTSTIRDLGRRSKATHHRQHLCAIRR